MTEHPMLFSGPMVRPILTCRNCGLTTLELVCPKCGSTERRKSQTRRLPTVRNSKCLSCRWRDLDWAKPIFVDDSYAPRAMVKVAGPNDTLHRVFCRYSVGDLLWVKETWAVRAKWDNLKPRELASGLTVLYAADGKPSDWGRNRSARFMPKKFARIWLRVRRVRAQWLQDISEADAWEEGIHALAMTTRGLMAELKSPNIAVAGKARNPGLQLPGRYYFACLWDSLHAKDGHGWAENPLVWATTLELVSTTGRPKP